MHSQVQRLLKKDTRRIDHHLHQSQSKSPCLCLTFSSSSELEESSLEKSKLLKAEHARDMIFWNFFLSPKWYFFLPLPLLLESFRFLQMYLLEELIFFRLGQSVMKWVVSLHSKQPLGDLLLSLRNLYKAQIFLVSRVISSSGMLLLLIRSCDQTRQGKLQSS
jgi:hypothetical protein